MNRFSPKKHFEIHGIWILSSLLFVFLFCVFIVKGIYNIDHSTLQEQANSLEKAIRQARISAAAPSFLCITKIETAAANEAAEWPDGKE